LTAVLDQYEFLLPPADMSRWIFDPQNNQSSRLPIDFVMAMRTSEEFLNPAEHISGLDGTHCGGLLAVGLLRRALEPQSLDIC
jgi:hypothetical protein